MMGSHLMLGGEGSAYPDTSVVFTAVFAEYLMVHTIRVHGPCPWVVWTEHTVTFFGRESAFVLQSSTLDEILVSSAAIPADFHYHAQQSSEMFAARRSV